MDFSWTRRLTARGHCCLLAVFLASTGCAAMNRPSWLAKWWRGGDKAGDDGGWPSATAKSDAPNAQPGQPLQGGSAPGAVQPVGYTAPRPSGSAAGAAPQHQGTSLWPYSGGGQAVSSGTTCTTAG